MKTFVCIMFVVCFTSAQSRLTFVKAMKEGMDGVTGISGATALVISPDNKNVYVTGSMSKAITIFSRDLATGALTYDTILQNGEEDSCHVKRATVRSMMNGIAGS